MPCRQHLGRRSDVLRTISIVAGIDGPAGGLKRGFRGSARPIGSREPGGQRAPERQRERASERQREPQCQRPSECQRQPKRSCRRRCWRGPSVGAAAVFRYRRRRRSTRHVDCGDRRSGSSGAEPLLVLDEFIADPRLLGLLPITRLSFAAQRGTLRGAGVKPEVNHERAVKFDGENSFTEAPHGKRAVGTDGDRCSCAAGYDDSTGDSHRSRGARDNGCSGFAQCDDNGRRPLPAPAAAAICGKSTSTPPSRNRLGRRAWSRQKERPTSCSS